MTRGGLDRDGRLQVSTLPARHEVPAAREHSGAARMRAGGVVALLLAVGTGVLVIAHAGVEIPVVSDFGPGGGRAVWPAATAFAVATVACAGVGFGLLRCMLWAAPAGVGLFAVTVVAALVPFRGMGSVAGAVLAVLGLAVVVAPAVDAVRRRAGGSAEGKRHSTG